MASKEELKQILRELRSGGDVARIKEKAAESLKKVDPKTLSLAEQELMQEGISEEELRRLCDVHLEVIGQGLAREKPDVEAAHPISILMEEHQIILQNLGDLRRIVEKTGIVKGFAELQGELEELRAISHLLLDTESHHKREEEALFPRLERHGVTGPPGIMRLEHQELRTKKKKLAELVEQAGGTKYSEFAEELSGVGGYIADNLGDHIYKEDNILYPTALETLEPEEWNQVLEEFEGIGYCCFAPGKA